jgi:hypothetical protein
MKTSRDIIFNDGKTDVQILEEQYAKYADKTGIKAVRLAQRIEGLKSFAKLYEQAIKTQSH